MATEDQTFALSACSLQGPHIKKNVRFTVSFPFVKPNLTDEPQEVVKIIQKFEEVCCQGLKRIYKKDFTIDESKNFIRELAVELDRVIGAKFKKCPLMSGKLKNKGTKEEQQYYILQWSEDLKHLQIKQTKDEEKQTTFSENSETEVQPQKSRTILSDWFWKLKQMKQNSVCPKGECEETLKDLHRQWKQRESSILPVMDWMVWTVLQSESTEKNSAPRQWVKNKQRSKNSVGLRIPNSVWNWITKSKDVVILDPNTANPYLLISEDGKSVKTETGNDFWEEFQMKRCKFDGWNCVQAIEGYNTGHHYWEVDVRWKCEWRVGVVKESAPRNGYVTMNTKAGYWNLRLQLGNVMALTEPVTKINLSKPSKIGVYLDIEEGLVSFYDAEKRRHIYTFNTDFSDTGNIYPMFGTVETDRALVIS